MIISYKTRISILSFIMLFVMPGLKVFSQDHQTNDATEHQAGDATVSPIMTAPCMGTRNEPSEDVNWQPLVTAKAFEHENPSPNEELIEKIKAEKDQLKKQAEEERIIESDSTLATEAVTPAIGASFAANLFNGGTPMDNTIAVSDSGLILSSANTTFKIYDLAGNTIYTKSVLAAMNDPLITNLCDEFVLYDKGSDRFIAFAEEYSTTYTPNHLLILFSKTNNPKTGGWWYYKLPGNPFGGQDWFDYPKVAISNNELYIAGNLFIGTGFHESAVWQIRKSDGYSGNASLTYQVWHNLAGTPFTVCPVSEGQGNSYGPGCYMVASNPVGGGAIQLYHLTNYIGSSPSITYNSITVAGYSPPGNSLQLGTQAELIINDSRMLSGFYLNGTIHFVFNTAYTNAGYGGIYYGRLNVSNNTITTKVFGTQYFDYGYPSVCSFATSATDKSVMIGYGLSGASIYPAIGVISCDNGMNWSAPLTVKSGTFNIDDGTYTTRWGDYSGTARNHVSATPSIWMNGMIGNTGNYFSSWVAEIHPAVVGINEVSNGPLVNAKVYPNPASGAFHLEFSISKTSDIEVDILDVQGRLVKDLFKGKAYSGTNEFSFDKSNLSPGVYFLTIKSDSDILKNEKIVITD